METSKIPQTSRLMPLLPHSLHRMECYVESSDIRNAYFQAEPIDRVVLMRQPSGGLPGIDPEATLLIRVPVYGLCDSGRGFWRKVDREARGVGFQVSRIFPAFYFYREGGKVVCVLTRT